MACWPPGKRILHRLRRRLAAGEATSLPSAQTNDELPNGANRVRVLQEGFIKIRLVTWNMHESLPSGDLTDLLGVPNFNADSESTVPSSASSTIAPSELPKVSQSEPPSFSLTDGHPYHLIVVGAEESPPASQRRLNSVSEWRQPSWTQILVSHLTRHESRRMSTNSASNSVRRDDDYVLVRKERLLGIYIAVFVLRAYAHLVEGSDSDTITLGKFGGRLPNKGACAVSLKLAGIRLVFVNAHLAAHTEHVKERLRDIAKLRAGLKPDMLLPEKSSRPKDVLSSFDVAFLSGDLNFRLELTRTHADGLMAMQSYEQALTFDQLNRAMKRRATPLLGLREHPIDFPPSYKWDLLKLEHSRARRKAHSLTGVQHEPEHHVQSAVDNVHLSPRAAILRQNSTPPIIGARPASAALPGATPPETRPELPRRPKSTGDLVTDNPRLAPEVKQQACFDSSDKQRVQSWTDRILYRSMMTRQPFSPSTKLRLSTLLAFKSSTPTFQADRQPRRAHSIDAPSIVPDPEKYEPAEPIARSRARTNSLPGGWWREIARHRGGSTSLPPKQAAQSLRGTLTCINYTTLSDLMKLEALSDHHPVILSTALHL
ncbi:uncharacterized protein L969DRAFT_94545 [Mixia osmundae IAM 14324]|uniref:Inositol polyphosphate-related phosphatase domain-containing protein n=1 Tax=Mixia osmundae (strain CBS 9802 / IAM 14324 / JCM 22182 / KY 12970) TaxID=764103 RepID=G7E0U5_MIXOS|nr:uncharacterized protein L969DRAFT_94545 [Mixia osmundae IAM 14324]KEI39484.1 hypothetical protein L969DRAFT_94545 [Mixia osmundae IAM 14324]GAA96455.1 hypothetical protein E5Q_03122 [Mixia osmundae IAM 14324]